MEGKGRREHARHPEQAGASRRLTHIRSNLKDAVAARGKGQGDGRRVPRRPTTCSTTVEGLRSATTSSPVGDEVPAQVRANEAGAAGH